MHIYSETTHNVQVEVLPTFAPEHSDLSVPRYVFSYRVTLKNLSGEDVQLLSRHWIITDGNGEVEEVRGPGVVGEQPTLKPGASYTYESFCPLPTPTGNMRGEYLMKSPSGAEFEIKIPLFFLRDASTLH